MFKRPKNTPLTQEAIYMDIIATNLMSRLTTGNQAHEEDSCGLQNTASKICIPPLLPLISCLIPRSRRLFARSRRWI